ncbi:hypothetical protein, conserved [Babesia ovata]|uniref:Uncharacterized protein n=1 Tax=Babesia ovata TaxID=189622 RepID=A0A2H6KFJ7_9APIC|nr:uncharacterized protein BOVATA_032660 [Babesia ovata]GBE61773.1 hypothetical protein, conserved [Babesia ovata]
MVYTSLTDAPQDFREGVDWLLAMKGKDAYKNLAAMAEAVHHLFERDTLRSEVLEALKKTQDISQKFLDQEGLKDQLFVKEFLQRLAKPLNKLPGALADSPDVTSTTVTKDLVHVVDRCEKFLKKSKLYKQYEAAYSSEASWEASCAKDPEACAVVLVGIAPMLYAGLRSLQVASAHALENESDSKAKERMGEVLKAVGFKESDCPDSERSSPVHKALRRVDEHVFTVLHNLAGFWVFN